MLIIKNIVSFLKEKRLKEVSKHIQGRLLDIACGDNLLVKKYYPNGMGLDVFNYYGNVDLVLKESSSIPLEDESFDTITIVAALNHIPNYKKTLLEAKRLLKKDGAIIITMPIGWPQKIWHKIAHDYDDDQIFRGINEEEEKYFLPIREIMKSLQEVGFNNIKNKKFLLGLNNLISAQK